MESLKGTIVNVDSDLLWYVYCSEKGEVDDIENALKEYVKGYANSGISDLIFCTFSQDSCVPTKVMTRRGEKYDKKIENGESVDYTSNWRVKYCYDIHNATKRLPYEILIEETKKYGMNAWVSIRMNDSHYPFEKTSFIRGDLFYEAEEKGWVIGQNAPTRYFVHCFDYAVKEIRDKMLAYIFETLDNYDVDGIELDFQREIVCFDYQNNPDCHKLMTELMREVKKYVLLKEKERNHSIKIGVRLVRDLKHNKTFGFDVETWVKEGLVDLVVPTSRFENTDSGIPVCDWKKMIEGTSVKVYAGLEKLLFYPYINSLETLKGFASQYLDLGVDGIYLFNYFRYKAREKDLTKDDLSKIKDETFTKLFSFNNLTEDKLRDIWNCCSDIKKAKKGKRRHVLTYTESLMVPNGETAWRILPKEINGEFNVLMETGDLTDSKTFLYLGVDDGGEIKSVKVDGKKVLGKLATDGYFVKNAELLVPPCEISRVYDNAKYFCYEFTANNEKGVSITIDGNCTLRYIEIVAKN